MFHLFRNKQIISTKLCILNYLCHFSKIAVNLSMILPILLLDVGRYALLFTQLILQLFTILSFVVYHLVIRFNYLCTYIVLYMIYMTCHYEEKYLTLLRDVASYFKFKHLIGCLYHDLISPVNSVMICIDLNEICFSCMCVNNYKHNLCNIINNS